MKVFLAGIIQGSLVAADIHEQDWRRDVAEIVRRHLPAAELYCHYSRHPQSIRYDLPDIRHTFQEGIRRAAECDLLIAYLPAASMGTAIEMYEAARAGAVVLAVTPMAANWVVRLYSDRILGDLSALEAFLAGGELAGLMRARRGP